jgi:hypothetical protein
VLILPRCVSLLCNSLSIFLEISMLIFSFFSNRRKISIDSSKPKRKYVETQRAKRPLDTPVSEPPSPSLSTPTKNQRLPSLTLPNHLNLQNPIRPLTPPNRNPNHSSSTVNRPSHLPQAPSSTSARNPNPDPHMRVSTTLAPVRGRRII